MLTKAQYGIKVADLGRFDRSNEFVNAGRETLLEIDELILMYWVHLGKSSISPLGRCVEHFERISNTASNILTSFLGAVLADVEVLAPRYLYPNIPMGHDLIAPKDLPVRLHQAEIRFESWVDGAEHTDQPVSNVELGVRYLTANSYPTEVPDLPNFAAGSIVRLVHERTFHRQPEIEATELEPRLLLAIDV